MTNRCCPYCGQNVKGLMWRHFSFRCERSYMKDADDEFGWSKYEKWVQVSRAWGRVPEQRRKAWLVQLALRGVT